MSFANTFKALSHPVRREILDLLKMGKMSAVEIADQFELTGATISHHLSVLKQADLVVESREKNFIYYELNTSVLEDMMVWLADLKGSKKDENELKNIRTNKCYDSVARACGLFLLESATRNDGNTF